MFLVKCVKVTSNETIEVYGKYCIGPFLKGQSTTIGNALRRVLLSNLNGLAITGVRVKGIDHEFSSIPNVKEDLIDILLNLKQIVLTGDITEPLVAKLNVQESGIITAKDIQLPKEITLVDPQQYIASLIAKGDFEMEFLISKGRNYFTKNNDAISDLFIDVDAIFMPVKKVNLFVEPFKKNFTSELEILTLEIWTNGSIKPGEALTSAAELLEGLFGLVKLFNTLVILPSSFDAPVQEKYSEDLETTLITDLRLSNRVYNCLTKANIKTLPDLLKYSRSDLLEIKNFGKKAATEVSEILKTKFNIELPD